MRLASPHPRVLTEVCHPYSVCAAMDTTAFSTSLPLWGLRKSLPGDEKQFAAKWSSCSCSSQMSGPPGTHSGVSLTFNGLSLMGLDVRRATTKTILTQHFIIHKANMNLLNMQLVLTMNPQGNVRMLCFVLAALEWVKDQVSSLSTLAWVKTCFNLLEAGGNYSIILQIICQFNITY